MGDQDELNATFPMRPNRGVNRGYQTGQLRADGTLATFTARVRADGVSRRSPAGRSCTATCSSPSRPAISSAASSSATTARRLRGRKAYDNAEFLASTDERFRPGLSVVRARRHALRRRHVSRHHPAQGLHHRVPARSHRRAQARERRSTWAASGASCTTRRGATRRRALSTESAAQLVAAARRTRTAGGATRRSSCSCSAATRPSSPALKKLAETAPGRAHAPARAVDARWTGQPRAGDRRQGARRSVARRARLGRAARRAMAGRAESVRCTAAVLEAHRRRGLGGPRAAGGVARRVAAGPRETALASLLERHGDDPVVVDAALSGLRGGEAAVLAKSAASRRADVAGARNGHHDAGGDDRARRAGRRGAALFQQVGGRRRVRRGSDRRCCAAPKSRCSARRRRAHRPGAAAAAAAAGGGRRRRCRPRPAAARRSRRRAGVSTRRRRPRGAAVPRRTGGAPAAARTGRRRWPGWRRRQRAAAELASRPRSARSPRAGGDLGHARGRAARAHRVARQTGRGGAGRAAHGRRAAAVRRRADGLSEASVWPVTRPDGRGKERLAPTSRRIGVWRSRPRRFRRGFCSTARKARSA